MLKVKTSMNGFLHAGTYLCVDGVRPRGRGKKKWDECVNEEDECNNEV